MKDYQRESLCHDPIHGYIPFISSVPDGETAEQSIIDHPWVQRLRQIHQLQTAWWVFPSAEHTRFQHVIGSMHMASRAIDSLYESLATVCPDVPSRGYVECLMRMAALLHDIGHGPFGHFFDAHFLADYDLTHEKLSAHIIVHELGQPLRGVRCCPNSELAESERLDPAEIASLVVRPSGTGDDRLPRWLAMLRSLFCGLYTVDNMDFVLRDAYMSGYSQRSYDLDRLLRYSFFNEDGLTIHDRGMNALLRFMRARSELFRTVYFHRAVRAIDKTLEVLFRDSKRLLFDGNPLEHLDRYLHFTEWSLLADVAEWSSSDDDRKRSLAPAWEAFLARTIDWVTVDERNLVYSASDAEQSSIFSSPQLVEQAIRERLPIRLAELEFSVDLARHIYRPHSFAATAGQNFLFNSATGCTRPLTDDQVFRQLPVSQRICRVYARRGTPADDLREISRAVEELMGRTGEDDLTNM